MARATLRKVIVSPFAFIASTVEITRVRFSWLSRWRDSSRTWAGVLAAVTGRPQSCCR